MRSRILLAFERAEFEIDQAERSAWLAFVIVGAGPTGVELAGALSEISSDTLRADFRSIDTETARIVLVEAADRVLGTFPSTLSQKAKTALERAGVTVRTNTAVLDMDADCVRIRTGDHEDEIPCKTVLWAAGVKPSSLALRLADRTGAPANQAGRLLVEPDLTVPGHSNIFALGDVASFAHQGPEPLPGLAAVATQQDTYVAKLIKRRLAGRNYRAFRYSDKGTLATIGRAKAVAYFGRVRITGYPAWLFWLFIHLMLLIGYENRVLVLVQWTWNYLTRNRSTRLIMRRYER
jgi:NADH dehydrogenase